MSASRTVNMPNHRATIEIHSVALDTESNSKILILNNNTEKVHVMLESGEEVEQAKKISERIKREIRTDPEKACTIELSFRKNRSLDDKIKLPHTVRLRDARLIIQSELRSKPLEDFLR